MTDPKRSPDPLYQLLRNDEVASFNERLAPDKISDFRGCPFRGSDLRGLGRVRDTFARRETITAIDSRTSGLATAAFPRRMRAPYAPR
jgi:hypothetical protein